MIKRYDFAGNEFCELDNGDYVRYDDIEHLLRDLSTLREHKKQQEIFSREVMSPFIQWLQDKASQWQSYDSGESNNPFYEGMEHGNWDCGEALEEKLKEIGL